MNSIDKYCINPSCQMKEAMQKIDDGGKAIGFVVNEDFKLLGTLTDGDIRRAILKGDNFNTTVDKIMNKNCTFVTRNYSKTLIETIFKGKSLLQIPVVDDYMRIVDIIFYSEFYKQSFKENTVIIMAGGLGSRLSPLTDEIPKPMLRVGAKPILETIIDQVRSYGFVNIVLSLNYKGDLIENYFQDGSNFGVKIRYVRENKRLGTAGALKLASQFIKESFVVINGDILTKLNFDQFLSHHIKHENDITVGAKHKEFVIPYGVLKMNNDEIMELDEKPAYHYFINAGMYCLEPHVIEYIPDDQYYDITELIEKTINNNQSVKSFPITEYWMDIGHVEDYHKANTDFERFFGSDVNAIEK